MSERDATDAAAAQGRALTSPEIAAILPHRYPFLLVDRIVRLTEDGVTATKNVTVNEWFFQGHFPDAPIMPGVLIVEAMAQAGGVMAAQSPGYDPERQILMFMAIDKVKFRRPVTPGDQLVLDVIPLRRGRVWKMQGTATVDGKVVCTAEFLATMADR